MCIIATYVRLSLYAEAGKRRGAIKMYQGFSSDFSKEIGLDDVTITQFGSVKLSRSGESIVKSVINDLTTKGLANLVTTKGETKLVFPGHPDVNAKVVAAGRKKIKREVVNKPNDVDEVLSYAQIFLPDMPFGALGWMSEDFFDFWKSRDWKRKTKNGTELVKDWKATFRVYSRQPWIKEKLERLGLLRPAREVSSLI